MVKFTKFVFYVKEIVLFLQAFRSSLKSKRGDIQIEFAKNENIIHLKYL